MAEEEEVLRLQQQGTLRKHCPQYLFSIDIYLFHNIIDNAVIRYLNNILLNLNCIAHKHLTNSVASQCLAEIFRCFYLLICAISHFHDNLCTYHLTVTGLGSSERWLCILRRTTAGNGGCSRLRGRGEGKGEGASSSSSSSSPQ